MVTAACHHPVNERTDRADREKNERRACTLRCSAASKKNDCLESRSYMCPTISFFLIPQTSHMRREPTRVLLLRRAFGLPKREGETRTETSAEERRRGEISRGGKWRESKFHFRHPFERGFVCAAGVNRKKKGEQQHTATERKTSL